MYLIFEDSKFLFSTHSNILLTGGGMTTPEYTGAYLDTGQDEGLSKYQINWHIDHQIHGGKSFILQETLSQGLLKLFKVRETRRVELLAEGEVSSATLLLLFDRMLWENKSKS